MTSPKDEDQRRGRANIEHCLQGGPCRRRQRSVDRRRADGTDGPADEIEERCRQEIKKLIPLAASLGQPILIENVWNRMFYQHDAPPEQTADELVRFVDSFNAPG